MANIIVYSSGFWAVAAVANSLLNKSVLVIGVYTVSKFGGITAITE